MEENKNIENEVTNEVSEEKQEIKSPKRGWVKELLDWAEAIAIAVVVALLLRNFVLTLALVSGSSMENTLSNGDRLYVNKLFYTPEKGDIVIIDTDKHPEGPLVKRVIATEGDTVYIDPYTYSVYVNDKLLEENYIKGKTVLHMAGINPDTGMPIYQGELFNDPKYSRQNPIKIGKGEVFAMGDNREHSSDSRNLGIFKEDEIEGHAIFRFWPLSDIDLLD